MGSNFNSTVAAAAVILCSSGGSISRIRGIKMPDNKTKFGSMGTKKEETYTRTHTLENDGKTTQHRNYSPHRAVSTLRRKSEQTSTQ